MDHVLRFIVPGSIKPGLIIGLIFGIATAIIFFACVFGNERRVSTTVQVILAALCCIFFSIPFAFLCLLFSRTQDLPAAIRVEKGKVYSECIIVLSCSGVMGLITIPTAYRLNMRQVPVVQE